jgi:general secretion pathway protein G
VKKSVAVAAAIAIVAACGRSEPPTATIMQQNLYEMRKAIRDFRATNGRLPKSLEELVQTRHLRQIPIDPITRRSDWRVLTEESVRVDDFSSSPPISPARGIVDVHSAASGTDPHGKLWSEY